MVLHLCFFCFRNVTRFKNPMPVQLLWRLCDAKEQATHAPISQEPATNPTAITNTCRTTKTKEFKKNLRNLELQILQHCQENTIWHSNGKRHSHNNRNNINVITLHHHHLPTPPFLLYFNRCHHPHFLGIALLLLHLSKANIICLLFLVRCTLMLLLWGFSIMLYRHKRWRRLPAVRILVCWGPVNTT